MMIIGERYIDYCVSIMQRDIISGFKAGRMFSGLYFCFRHRQIVVIPSFSPFFFLTMYDQERAIHTISRLAYVKTP